MDAATALRGLQRAVSTPFALRGVAACTLRGTVSKLCGWCRFTTVTEKPGEEYPGASRVGPLGSLSRPGSDAHTAGAGVNVTSPFTMSETELQVTVDPLEGANEGISILRLCRPAVRNALGRQLVRELNEAVDNLRREPSTRCVVLASAVEGVFCAGADLKERKKMTQQETYEVVAGLRQTMSRVSELPMPVIVAVEGKAVGGGAELALACDIRVAGRAAQFSWPEAHIGIIPGAGGTQRLPRLVGPAAALELMLTARPVAAEEAHRIGLVQHVTEPGQALERALELGRDIKRGAPTALRMIKLAVHQGLGTDLRTGLKLEELCYDRVLPTQDRLEGLRAHAEKRAPLFTGS